MCLQPGEHPSWGHQMTWKSDDQPSNSVVLNSPKKQQIQCSNQTFKGCQLVVVGRMGSSKPSMTSSNINRVVWSKNATWSSPLCGAHGCKLVCKPILTNYCSYIAATSIVHHSEIGAMFTNSAIVLGPRIVSSFDFCIGERSHAVPPFKMLGPKRAPFYICGPSKDGHQSKAKSIKILVFFNVEKVL